MVTRQKPSLEEALEHYGIKGMKWGVRRSDAQLARARGAPSPRQVRDKVNQLEEKRVLRDRSIDVARKSVAEDNAKVTKARVKVVKTFVKEGRKAANEVRKGELKELKAKRLRNPDRQEAAKLKSGEIAAEALLNSPSAALRLTIESLNQQLAINKQQRSLKEKDKYSK